MRLMQRLLRACLRWFYHVQVHGLENFSAAGQRVLIVANHASYLDPILIAVFVPDKLTFAVNTHVARQWWMRPIGWLVNLLPMDPTNPLAIKSLIAYLKTDRKAVIFPEGRITVTGALMKIYQGPGLIADRSAAMVLPVRLEGPQYTPFSRLRGRVRLRWRPRISLTFLPPQRLHVPDEVRGRARRHQAGQLLSDLMTTMIFTTANSRRTLYQALLDARQVHGGKHVIVEDIQRTPLTYNDLILRTLLVGEHLAHHTVHGEVVGVLLPSANSTVITFFAAQLQGRVPAMLNFTLGAQGLRSAIETAQIKSMYTSRRFIEGAKLGAVVERLQEHVRIIYLEDVAAKITLAQKLRAWQRRLHIQNYYRHCNENATTVTAADNAAVILFTSGSEGTPKGVVLSHANLLANREQLAARVAFTAQDIILNALPLFHSFGLTAGTLLPLLSGMRTFFYPSPLHYRIVPEVSYDINATILFGTNTFLSGYAKFAHPYDFYSVRYVFAGAERLQPETREVWAQRFGIRILEGYGATETSPVLACNTPMEHKVGTVGRFLPGIEYRLETVPGIEEGGRLWVRGANIMRGYFLHAQPGVLVPPVEGWYDTGDIVSLDAQGYITIRGRAKRFAKIGGEMVSLTTVEALTERAWPGVKHAVVTLPDTVKGEQLVLLTEQHPAPRASLLAQARQDGLSEIHVPKRILRVAAIPLLGTGKTDYAAAQQLAQHHATPATHEADADEESA